MCSGRGFASLDSRGSVTLPAGVVRSGSFSIGVDASAQSVRWALAVTQPE
ncbi:hypothetical protein [Streptomyces sp. NPDC057677]